MTTPWPPPSTPPQFRISAVEAYLSTEHGITVLRLAGTVPDPASLALAPSGQVLAMEVYDWGIFDFRPVSQVAGFDLSAIQGLGLDLASAVVSAIIDGYGQIHSSSPVLAAFDEAFYLGRNPDVAAAVTAGLFSSGQDHFKLYGWREDRDPSPYFDLSSYISAHPDVANAGVDPWAHYQAYGLAEGRIAFLAGADITTVHPDICPIPMI
jgi:hypothetical protein